MSQAKINLDGLLGSPYDEQEGGCYGLVRRALAQLSVELPSEAAECLVSPHAFARRLKDSAPVQVGDVLCLEMPAEDPDDEDEIHLGVCISGQVFLHARKSGARTDSIASYHRLGRIRWRARPLALIDEEGGDGA